MPSSTPSAPFQHLEKRYFEPGDLGFPVWRTFGGIIGMCICNDRRWPETYRVMGLQGVEMVVLGYNTPSVNSQKREEGAEQAAVPQPALGAGRRLPELAPGWSRVAKARRRGRPSADRRQLHRRTRTARSSREAKTEDDELVVADCDLDATTLRQGDDLRLRAPPPHRALRPDHQPHRRGAAAGKLDLWYRLVIRELHRAQRHGHGRLGRTGRSVASRHTCRPGSL